MFKNILIFLLVMVAGSILYLHALNKNHFIKVKIDTSSINIEKKNKKEEYWDKFLNEYVNKIDKLYEKIFKENKEKEKL